MTCIIRQFASILRKDFLLEYSYRVQFILTIAGIVFDLATFYFVARFIGPSTMPRLVEYGGDYFAFVALGLAFGRYQWISLYTFSQSLREQQVMGTLEMVLASPIKPETMILGSSLWSFLFGTVEVALYLLIATTLGLDLSSVNAASLALAIVLTIFSMSAFGILSASFVVVFKRGDPIAWALATGGELLGGVYYPTAVLPAFLKGLAAFLPITHSLRAVRLAVLKGFTPAQLSREFLILGLFSMILLPLSLLAFRFAIRIARRDGTLSQF